MKEARFGLMVGCGIALMTLMTVSPINAKSSQKASAKKDTVKPSPHWMDKVEAVVRKVSTDAEPIEASLVGWSYKNNRIKADEWLKNKVFWITGEIKKVDRDREGIAYVSLDTEEFLQDLKCYFAPTHDKALGELKTGQIVVIKGYCTGVDNWGDIIIGGCYLKK